MYQFNNNLLRNCRKLRGYTQESFAKIIGIARTTYAEYEQGKIQPPIDKIQRICTVLKMSQDEFVKVDGKTEIELHKLKLKKKIPDAQKLIMVKQLEEKICALNDLDRIQDVIKASAIEPTDKNILLSLMQYITPNYELTQEDIDLKKRIESITKE